MPKILSGQRKKEHKFQEWWLDDPNYKRWVVRKGPTTPYCKWCCKTLRLGTMCTDSLISHERSKTHQKYLKHLIVNVHIGEAPQILNGIFIRKQELRIVYRGRLPMMHLISDTPL